MTTTTAPQVSGRAATMTVLAMDLGYSITAGDPTILSANISEVRAGLHFLPSTASFVASLATLTLAAAVLGAGALGDLYGMKRMFVVGLLGTIVFGVLAAAAPNVIVLMIARAGVGIAFAFLLGLSLAIINAVFPPGRRAAAIALYLGAGYAMTTFQPAIGSLLFQHFGWRPIFLVAPVAAVLTLVITLRYVPETPRGGRRLDVVGLALVAVALLALIYGISRLQGGFKVGALVPIAVGLVAAAGFVAWELHTSAPALDMRIFRSSRFDAAVGAGATFNFLQGGSTIMMGSAPADLGGAVSAVKSAVGQASYSLGPALFALVGTTLFIQDGKKKLTGSGITEEQARDALAVAHGSTSASASGGVLDPERARWVVETATGSMVHAIHTLSLIMAVVPVAAIVAALVLLRPKDGSSST
jgi:MFS family permease